MDGSRVPLFHSFGVVVGVVVRGSGGGLSGVVEVGKGKGSSPQVAEVVGDRGLSD
jgi:hypothetical protein